MQSARLSVWLAGLSLSGLILFVFVTMLLAALIGHVAQRMMLRAARDTQAEDHSQESYLVGSMLGILALLMAFSFSMALDRYEERRHLVIREANAIGTSYLRAQLLDEPYRTRLSHLLVAYTDNRIALGSESGATLGRQLAINDRLLTDIWAAVVAARDSANAHGLTTGILITFNEVIDLDAERKVARQVRVPAPVLMLLYVFLILTAAMLGYVVEQPRARLGVFVLFILLSLYGSIIADLNRPTSGNITESQEPMLMLRQSLKSQPPTAFDRSFPPGSASRG
jgi:hypothetical protein